MKPSDIYFLSMIIMVFCFSCKEDDEAGKAGTFYGTPVTLGAGEVKSFVKTDNEGKPLSMGIALSKEALTQLPTADSTHLFYQYILKLPKELEETTFNHIMVDWNPMGHEPENVYTTPHFDFHFYMISEAERMNIGAEDPKMEIIPDAKYLPADYFHIPGGVPMMGKHWVDKLAPELASQPFTTTFLYGSYDGEVTFMEPMITLDYILAKPEKHLPIKQPAAFEKAGYYPTQYAITYEASTGQYLITLENMTKRVIAENSNAGTPVLLASANQAYTGFEQFNFPICGSAKTKTQKPLKALSMATNEISATN